MPRNYPRPSGFADDSLDQSGLPLDIEPEAFSERLEPPTAGQDEDLSGSKLTDLLRQEPRSLAPLHVKQGPAWITATRRRKFGEVRPGDAA